MATTQVSIVTTLLVLVGLGLLALVIGGPAAGLLFVVGVLVLLGVAIVFW
jgi:hypothetical protein